LLWKSLLTAPFRAVSLGCRVKIASDITRRFKKDRLLIQGALIPNKMVDQERYRT